MHRFSSGPARSRKRLHPAPALSPLQKPDLRRVKNAEPGLDGGANCEYKFPCNTERSRLFKSKLSLINGPNTA
jgi:hypothetical protein